MACLFSRSLSSGEAANRGVKERSAGVRLVRKDEGSDGKCGWTSTAVSVVHNDLSCPLPRGIISAHRPIADNVSHRSLRGNWVESFCGWTPATRRTHPERRQYGFAPGLLVRHIQAIFSMNPSSRARARNLPMASA
jgi:hypothetical protein